MKIRFFLSVFCSCLLTILNAQSERVNAVLDFSKEQEGHVTILGKSISNESKSYTYSMVLTKVEAGNKANSNQSGKVTLIANQEKTISSIQINLSEISQFEVTLQIFDNEKLVAKAYLKNDPIFFDAYKKLPITASPKIVEKSNIGAPKNQPKKEQQVQKKSNQKQMQIDDIEIQGLIIDDTRSKIGRDFYDLFYGKWIEPQGANSFTITVSELPARGRASQVVIEVDGSVVFKKMIQPRQEVIDLMAGHAVKIVENFLVQRKDLNKELEDQDQNGSGLF